jgi:ankyrin repeat protein
VKVLLKNGASISKSTTCDATTPLFIAAAKGHLEIVKVLLKNGASIDKSTICDATTPLFMAAQEGYLDIVKVLVEYDASIDKATTDVEQHHFLWQHKKDIWGL